MLAGGVLIAGLITAWTLTTPSQASASSGSSGSSLLTSVSCTSMTPGPRARDASNLVLRFPC